MNNREKCPDCGRLKARTADDAIAGDCDKWFAINDPEAFEECERIKQSKKYCHAQRDGECFHKDCPQLRDNEPEKTGRSCPLIWFDYED